MLNTANENCLPRTEEMILVPVMSHLLQDSHAMQQNLHSENVKEAVFYNMTVWYLKQKISKPKNIFNRSCLSDVYVVYHTQQRPFRTRSLNLSYNEMGIFIP